MRNWEVKNKRLYDVWYNMHQRCENPKNRDFPSYGAKGVKVCDRWCSYNSFKEDMGERPLNKTLDRIDTAGDYSPENCRWATFFEQSQNRSTTLLDTRTVFRMKQLHYLYNLAFFEVRDILQVKADARTCRDAMNNITWRNVVTPKRKDLLNYENIEIRQERKPH